MTQIMTLRKAIEENCISLGTEIPYKPDEGRTIELKVKTGIKEDQIFETTELSWKLIELERGQLALLAVTPTEQFLILKGKRGAENIKKILDDICGRLWGSFKLGLDAKGISKTDFDQMSNADRNTLKQIWIGEHRTIKISGEVRYAVSYIDEENNLKSRSLFSTMLGKRTMGQQIRPIVYLPDKILIDVSTNTLYKDYNEVAKVKLSEFVDSLEENEKITKQHISQLKEILEFM